MRHRLRIFFSLCFALCWSVALAIAQQPDLEPKLKAADLPTVTFTLDWPQGKPNHYAITVESSGRAAYESTSAATSETGDPYSVRFIMTPQERDRILALAKQANYFSGNFDFTRRKIAFTGRKRLAYSDATRHNQTTYNWSESAPIQQLTRIFDGISNTLESGQRLAYLRRFDRLGLAKELGQMQRLASEGQLAQLQTIAPTLQEIASDAAVMDLARQRARSLLDTATRE